MLSGYAHSAQAHIDVVIPAYNEEAHIDKCLDHVLSQDYPRDRLSVVVVDAGSTDSTAALVQARAEGEPRLRLVNGNGRLNAGQAMNLGIAAGSGELVARVDAHTYLDPGYLRTAAEIMADEDADVAEVGGQPLQEGETRFGRAAAIARQSRFGVGDSVYSDTRSRAYVDTVQGGVYRRAALEEVGPFSETMLVGEDIELNWRLRRAGFRILLETRLRFRYTTRSSWGAAFRQYRNYGRARVRTLAAHPTFVRPRHLAPSAAVGVLATLTFAAPFSRRAGTAAATAAAAYGTAALCAGLSAAGRDDRRLAPTVAACFTALHLGYGVGMIEGAGEWAAARLGLCKPRNAVAHR